MYNSSSYTTSAWNQSASSLVNSTENVLTTSGSTQQNDDAAATAAAAGEFVLPVVGWPGPMFTVIHLVALCSLSITITVSCCLLVYLCVTSSRNRSKQKARGSHSADDEQRQTDHHARSDILTTAKPKSKSQTDRTGGKKDADTRSFWSWNIGERMVVYIAICDLFFGISHTLDHSYMLATHINPPDAICSPMAFFLMSATFSQWFVVLFSAISACSLIVLGKKIPAGRYDWRLLVGTYGLAVILAAISWGLHLLGPSGVWCFVDLRTSMGRMTMNAIGLFQICAFGVVAVSYAAIWYKIQRTAKLMTGSGDNRYRNSARVMMIFVAVFILQWWSLVAFTIWSLIATPHIAILVVCVLLINLGGLYNCIAYTVIRRRLQNKNSSRAQQGVTFDDGSSKVTTFVSSTSLATTTTSSMEG